VIPSPFKSRLSDFEGASVTGFGPESDVPEVFELETRPAALDRLEGQRQLRFESIYPTKA
jgi:hypothetical protein